MYNVLILKKSQGLYLMKKVRANILPFLPVLFARKSSEDALRANIPCFFRDLFARLLPIR